MKKVQFPLVKDGVMIVYPDAMNFFKNVQIQGELIIADYYGAMEFDPYVEPEPENIFISKFTFRSLFTFAERLGFDNFEENESLTTEQKQYLRTITKDFEMAEEIDLKLTDTISGLQYLESIGIIGPGRAAEVLAYRP